MQPCGNHFIGSCIWLAVSKCTSGRLRFRLDAGLPYQWKRTRETLPADLKLVGYGYSADGGKTFPLRGTTTEKMPSLQGSTGKRFLITKQCPEKDVC
ncbi:MAG: hypothetical protein IPI14_08280 [Polaromonas sp.]|nr:hypothetical protein [Polaromonas sp.]